MPTFSLFLFGLATMIFAIIAGRNIVHRIQNFFYFRIAKNHVKETVLVHTLNPDSFYAGQKIDMYLVTRIEADEADAGFDVWGRPAA